MGKKSTAGGASSTKAPAKATPFDGAAARRIMSATYAEHGHIPKGSFAAKAQAQAAKNMNTGRVGGWSSSSGAGVSKGSGGKMRAPMVHKK